MHDLGMDIAGAKDLKQENRDKIVSKASEGKPAVENKTTQRPMHKPAESQTQSKPLDAKPEVEAKNSKQTTRCKAGSRSKANKYFKAC